MDSWTGPCVSLLSIQRAHSLVFADAGAELLTSLLAFAHTSRPCIMSRRSRNCTPLAAATALRRPAICGTSESRAQSESRFQNGQPPVFRRLQSLCVYRFSAPRGIGDG